MTSGADGVAGPIGVSVRLIGSVCIVVNGEATPCRGLRESALLGRLALDAGLTVTRDRLVTDVWTSGEVVSNSALRVQISRLRKLLSDAGASLLIETDANGYRLCVDRSAVDVLLLADRISSVASAPNDRTNALGTGVVLPPLDRVRLLEGLEDFEFARAAISRFDRLVSSAHQRHARDLLDDGNASAAVEVLSPLFDLDAMAAEPASLLMRALRLVGSRRAALQIAARHREALADVGLLPWDPVLDEERRSLDGSSDSTGRDDPPLGRESLCDDVMSIVAAMPAAGRGGLVCVSGDAGVGKTHVLDWLTVAAERTSARVLRSSGDRFESVVTFALIRRLLTDLDIVWDGETTDDPAPSSVWQRVRAKDQVVDHVSSLLGEPIVMIVDDLHWSDETSLVALRGLAALTATHPLTIIAAGRPAGDWRSYLADRAVVSATVDRLDPDASRQLGERVVGSQLDASLGQIVASAHGLPLLIVELLRGRTTAAQSVGGTSGRSDASDQRGTPTFGDVVAQRIAELPADAVAVARATSTLGANATVAVLAAFLERSPLDVGADVDAAVAVGLLRCTDERVEFAHDLVRQSFDQTVGAQAHAALHRDALDFWSKRGAPSATLASHAMLAGRSGKREEMTGWLSEAIDLSRSLEPDSTLEFLDRALAFTAGDVVGRYEIQRARVEALTAAGRSAEAMQLLEGVIELVPERRPEAVLRLAGLRVLDNDLSAGLADIARVVDAPGASDNVSPSVYARLVALSATISVIMLDGETGRPKAEQAAALGLECGDVVARSIAAAALGRLAAFDLDPAALSSLRLAVELADIDTTRQAHAYQPLNLLALTALDFADHLAVEQAIAAGEALSARLFAPWMKPLFDAVEMTVAYRRADFEMATTVAERILDRRGDVGAGSVDAWTHAVIAQIAVRRGNIDAASEAADAAAEALRTTPNSLGSGVVVAAQAMVAAAAGDTEGAFEMVQDSWNLYEAVGVRRRLMTFAAPLTLLAIARGDAATSERVADAVGLMAESSGADAHRALALRIRGLIDGDIEALARASRLARSADHLLDASDCHEAIKATRDGRPLRVLA